MGKLIVLPGVDLFPPSRNELVEDATETVMKEISATFASHQFDPGSLRVWYKEIREYFWKQEFKLTNRNFRDEDLKRWKSVWRATALEYIQSKRIQ